MQGGDHCLGASAGSDQFDEMVKPSLNQRQLATQDGSSIRALLLVRSDRANALARATSIIRS
jgi:hypothetical protein